jgi:threonine aldolase
MTQFIDLRSDTVTKPSDEMREVIAKAPVGDDQFGEDPTVNLLQEKVALLLGKESALWLPTGTMANQVALRTLTRPGDDVIVSQESHAVWHETGASAANSGVQFTSIGKQGLFTPEEFLAAIKPKGHIIYPPTTLVEIENTHNRAGGIIFPQKDAGLICSEAAKRGISTYLDGARLWNAAAASGKSPAELAAPFDLVSAALSKGLGAPGGSLLSGSKEIIGKCVRYRRMLGGAMRQVGIFAAAGIYAIDNNLNRLSDDHFNAKLIAEKLTESSKIVLDMKNVQTNILVFGLTDEAPDAPSVVKKAGEHGVLIFAFGPRVIRAVTHLDVSRQQCEQAAEIILEIVGK